MARVPLQPRLTCCQKRSRPTPNGETTPMPLMTTRCGPVERHEAHIIPGRARSRPRRTPTARLFAWMGAGAVCPLAQLFPLQLLGGVRQHADGPLGAGVVVWNVVLFSVFALHHSLFARERDTARADSGIAPTSNDRSTSGSPACCSSPCAGSGSRSPGIVWEVDGRGADSS